jgi:hypothetical protein
MNPLRLHLHAALGLAPLLMAACNGAKDDCADDDCDPVDTDVADDTDVVDTDVADDTDAVDTDVADDTYGSDDTDVEDTDVDTDGDTDVVDTDTDPPVLVTCTPVGDGHAHVAGGGTFDGSTEWRVCLPIPSSDPSCLAAGAPGGPRTDQLLTALCDGVAGCDSFWALYSITCGPYDEAGACCYNVVPGPGAVVGRPFATDEGFRTARAAARGGWSGSVEDLGRDDAAAAAWAVHALGEHASVASFASFVAELLALGAPAELVRDAIAAMQDEVRHAELAFGIASALAGESLGPTPLPTTDARRRATPSEVLRAVIVEGCVGETVAAHDAGVRRDLGCAPPVRAALAQIADDEARHAALAWRTVRWILGAHPSLRADADEAFVSAVAARRGAAGTGEPANPWLGLHDDAAQAAAARRALDEVVVPLWADLRGA